MNSKILHIRILILLSFPSPPPSLPPQVRAHYFEDGNVQLQTKKACANTSIPKGSAGDVASAVQSHIATEEKVVQEGLEEM